MRPIINHIGVSGGKDSTALLLWALHESGYPKESLDFTFADTDNEHEWTYDQIVVLSEHSVEHGGPKIKWLKPKRGFYEMVLHHGRFPSPQVRFCTRELKVIPMKQHVKALVKQGFDLVLHSGIRAAESDERSKMVQREDVSEHITEFRPLLRWGIDDVWAIHKRHGVKPNPLYAAGAQRVGCFPCIMSKKCEIAAASKISPDKFQRIKACEGPNKNGFSYNTFFEHKKTPKRFRSQISKKKNGDAYMVGTIDDVVEWATEPERLAAQQPSLFQELNTAQDDRYTCQSTWGSCE